MSGRAWIVLLVLLGALALVTGLFAVQNSMRTTLLSLDLGFVAFQTAHPLSIPALLGATFGGGFLLALILVLPRFAAQGRRVRALERQIALTSPDQAPWR